MVVGEKVQEDVLPSFDSFLSTKPASNREPSAGSVLSDVTTAAEEHDREDVEVFISEDASQPTAQENVESDSHGEERAEESVAVIGGESQPRLTTSHSIESILSPETSSSNINSSGATEAATEAPQKDESRKEEVVKKPDVLTLSTLSSSAAETMFESRSMLTENGTETASPEAHCLPPPEEPAPTFATVHYHHDTIIQSESQPHDSRGRPVDEIDCKPHLSMYEYHRPAPVSVTSAQANPSHMYEYQPMQTIHYPEQNSCVLEPTPPPCVWPVTTRPPYSPRYEAAMTAPYAVQYERPSSSQPLLVNNFSPTVVAHNETHFDDAACARYLYNVASSMSTALHNQGNVFASEPYYQQPVSTLNYPAAAVQPTLGRIPDWKEPQPRSAWSSSSHQHPTTHSYFSLSKPHTAQYGNPPLAIIPQQHVVTSAFDRQQRVQASVPVLEQATNISNVPLNIPVEKKPPTQVVNSNSTKSHRSRTQSFEIRQTRLLDPLAVYHMTQWLTSHMTHPYPTQEEKKQLADLGSITVAQVSSWFANKRSRLGTSFGKRAKLTDSGASGGSNGEDQPASSLASTSGSVAPLPFNVKTTGRKVSDGTPPFLMQLSGIGSGKENSASGSDSDHSAHARFKDFKQKRGLSEISPNVDVTSQQRAVNSNLFCGNDSFIKRQKLL